MKNILISFFILSVAFGQQKANAQTATNEIEWLTLEQAQKLNKKKPKLFLIDAYTDWCGWCKKMDASTYKDAAVVSYVNENFYAVKLNAEQRDSIEFNGKIYKYSPGMRSNEVAVELLKGQMMYPTTIFLDKELKNLSVIPGYQSVSDMIKILKYFGEKTYLNTNWDEYNLNYKP